MEESLLRLTDADKANFLEIARWGKFLGIVGFVLSGLIVFVALIFVGGAMGESMDAYPGLGGGIGFFYMLASLLYIFPSLYVYRFSARIKNGIHSNSQEMCSSAYINLKRLFLFMGVMTIVVLALYALVFFGVFVGGLMGGML